MRLHRRGLEGDLTAGRCLRKSSQTYRITKSYPVTLTGLLVRLQAEGGLTGLFVGEKRLVGSLQDHAAEPQDEGAVG